MSRKDHHLLQPFQLKENKENANGTPLKNKSDFGNILIIFEYINNV